MKKVNFFLQTFILCCMSLLFASCFSEEDFGYPEKVPFSAEGGELVVTGETLFWYAEIQDYNSNHGRKDLSNDEMETIEFDWLRVEYKTQGTNTVKVIAMPNTTKESRNLYIKLYSGQEYAVVKVTQNKEQ